MLKQLCHDVVVALDLAVVDNYAFAIVFECYSVILAHVVSSCLVVVVYFILLFVF